MVIPNGRSAPAAGTAAAAAYQTDDDDDAQRDLPSQASRHPNAQPAALVRHRSGSPGVALI